MNTTEGNRRGVRGVLWLFVLLLICMMYMLDFMNSTLRLRVVRRVEGKSESVQLLPPPTDWTTLLHPVLHSLLHPTNQIAHCFHLLSPLYNSIYELHRLQILNISQPGYEHKSKARDRDNSTGGEHARCQILSLNNLPSIGRLHHVNVLRLQRLWHEVKPCLHDIYTPSLTQPTFIHSHMTFIKSNMTFVSPEIAIRSHHTLLPRDVGHYKAIGNGTVVDITHVYIVRDAFIHTEGFVRVTSHILQLSTCNISSQVETSLLTNCTHIIDEAGISLWSSLNHSASGDSTSTKSEIFTKDIKAGVARTVTFDDLPTYDEVFLLSSCSYSLADFMKDLLPKLAYYLPYLLHYSGIRIHVNINSSVATEILNKLGIASHRIIRGDVRARVAYIAQHREGQNDVLGVQLLSALLRNSVPHGALVSPKPHLNVIKNNILLQHKKLMCKLQETASLHGLTFAIFNDTGNDLYRLTRSSVVFGTSGPGLLYMLFSPPGSVVIESLCLDRVPDYTYSQLARALGLLYIGIVPTNFNCHWPQPDTISNIINFFLTKLPMLASDSS